MKKIFAGIMVLLFCFSYAAPIFTLNAYSNDTASSEYTLIEEKIDDIFGNIAKKNRT